MYCVKKIYILKSADPDPRLASQACNDWLWDWDSGSI